MSQEICAVTVNGERETLMTWFCASPEVGNSWWGADSCSRVDDQELRLFNQLGESLHLHRRLFSTVERLPQHKTLNQIWAFVHLFILKNNYISTVWRDKNCNLFFKALHPIWASSIKWKITVTLHKVKMAKNGIKIKNVITTDIDTYHDKCHIFVLLKIKEWFLPDEQRMTLDKEQNIVYIWGRWYILHIPSYRLILALSFIATDENYTTVIIDIVLLPSLDTNTTFNAWTLISPLVLT